MKEIFAICSVLLIGWLPVLGQTLNGAYVGVIENHEAEGPLFGEQMTLFALVTNLVQVSNDAVQNGKIDTGNLPDLARRSFYNEKNKSRCSAKLKLKGEQLKAGEQVIGKSLHGALVIVIKF